MDKTIEITPRNIANPAPSNIAMGRITAPFTYVNKGRMMGNNLVITDIIVKSATPVCFSYLRLGGFPPLFKLFLYFFHLHLFVH